MNIVEFLEARIAEDEAVAKVSAGRPAPYRSAPLGPDWTTATLATPYGGAGIVVGVDDLWDCEGSATLMTSAEAAAHIALWDPTRALAECAAKRAIVGLHGKSCDYASEYRKPTPLIVCLECGPHEDVDWRTNGSGNFPCPTLRHLAAVYDQHPDYDTAWRP